MRGRRSLTKNVCRAFSFSFMLNNVIGVNLTSGKYISKYGNNLHKTAKEIADNTINGLNNKKEQMRKKKAQLDQEMRAERDSQKTLRDKIREAEKDVDKANDSIYSMKKKMDEQQKKITDLEKVASEKKNEIKQKARELGRCLRAIYTAKVPNFFEICFSSSDFNDFVDKAQVSSFFTKKISLIVQDVRNEIKKIKNTIKETEKIKKSYEDNIKLNEQQKLDLEKKISDLDKLYQESEKKQSEIRHEIDTQNSELKKIDAEINSYYESLRKKSIQENKGYIPKYTGNRPRLLWPVKGFRRITSSFHDSANRKSSHGAIDIASDFVNGSRKNIYGAEIRAPIDMLILYSADGYNGGYGNYIVSTFEYNNHRYQIYFGHLSKRVKSKGQQVKRGEVIGYVGNTGFSTGPHLHFEIRENGSRIDPMSFPYDY